jgi:hypothetical protein
VRPAPGWNDPDATAIGSVSREVTQDTIRKQGRSVVTRRTREWSFVTLDHPTFETRSGSGALWERVILPLVDLEKRRDDVYSWLEIVFQFCEGKPFVYYSQYVPSARIYALARSHKVQMRWCPLGRLSDALLARHRSWHQLWVSASQWRRCRRSWRRARVAVAIRTWRPSGQDAILRFRIRADPSPVAGARIQGRCDRWLQPSGTCRPAEGYGAIGRTLLA